MRVLFYIPNLTKKDGGIYQYALSVLQGMGQTENIKNEYFVFTGYPNEDVAVLESKYRNIHQIPTSQNESKFRFVYRNVRTLINKIFTALKFKSQISEVSYVSHLIGKYDIDVLHSPHQSIPKNIEIPSLVTLHDVQELYYPEYFTAEQRAKRAVSNLYVTRRASKVVVSFDHVKEDIVRFFQLDADKVRVCFLSIKGMWFEKFLKNEKMNSAQILEAKEFFVFYPAVTWPHKNHIQLLKALELLKREKNFIVNLVCTGHQTVFKENIEREAKALGVDQQLTFKGLVSDEELYLLYKSTSAVVIPSLYEAGSFPLIEAMVLGAPVICANTTSLPNTIGDNDFVFDGKSVEDLAHKLHLILTDVDFKQKNKANSAARADALMNSSVLQVFTNLYQEICK